MRILFLNGHPVWRNGLPWGFSQLGHTVKIMTIINEDNIFRQMEEFKPDLLMSVGWIDQYSLDNLAAIKKAAKEYRCIHAYWATEDIFHFSNWSLPLVKEVEPDVVFTINAACIPSYRDLSIPAYHLDFAYNPIFDPIDGETAQSDYFCDIAMVANNYDFAHQPQTIRYLSLETLFRPLIERGYHLAVWGYNWDQALYVKEWLPAADPVPIQFRGALDYENTYKIYINSKIIINPQNENRFFTQVTSRTYEITGCGGFQLTLRTPAVEKLFKNREHLVMSSTPEETVQLIDYYLKHDDERSAVRHRGRAEILKNHTYLHRAAYVLACLNLLE